jgi:hypothetical protein
MQSASPQQPVSGIQVLALVPAPQQIVLPVQQKYAESPALGQTSSGEQQYPSSEQRVSQQPSMPQQTSPTGQQWNPSSRLQI